MSARRTGVTGGPYREPGGEPPRSHRGHGLAANAKHAGSPTRLRFCACGAVIDEEYREVKTRPMRELLEER